ncbi:peptidoglycan D,D-transpeptidase FtsI family protein [Opitutus terrae]|uniref:Peptidoglycan glycosyltransferase n=1 Tax=Opitutus terrae (strain DSM 11246 / JCM 15787 / PB90-1) TaxID=452637 RepID=B1ZPT0_OPITP|nr:penicillin-binding transpeptidase domain-containing protein [Opitutus terrae]ACB75533.1 Peptidoglycan glycosyltransferase [Opitutus terrae PB90-1]
MTGLLAIVFAGLVRVQLVHSASYVARGQRQHHRQLVVPASRGNIYDRERRLLATTRTPSTVAFDLGQLRNEAVVEGETVSFGDRSLRRVSPSAKDRLATAQRHVDRLNAVTGRAVQLDAARLDWAYRRRPNVPFVLIEDVTVQEATRVAAAFARSSTVQLARTPRRWYPFGRTAAQVLGGVHREIVRPASRVSREGYRTMAATGTTGNSGIEKLFNRRLEGHPGAAVVQLDVFGFLAGAPVVTEQPIQGEDVVLSLDVDLQLAAERGMSESAAVRGAAVALSIQTGEVLAMVSRPDYDLNVVSPVLTPELKLQIDAEEGWLNRATQGLYPPGSTFKIFTALAGLRTGALHVDDVVQCDGYLEMEGRRFPCHRTGGHGEVTLATAMAYSCNVFAYQVGLAAGPEALAAEARRFHLAQPTGIELPFETDRMLVPDPPWKRRVRHEAWTFGDTINYAIGQGFLRCSPLQAACATASLARRESLTVPTILYDPQRSPTGTRVAEPLGLNDGDYAALIESLEAVVQTGIGRDAQIPGVRIAGKTGTAQVVGQEGKRNVAWFVAFAPVERPQIAVAVALEGPDVGAEFGGARHAAPVVREMLRKYFDKHRLD